MFDNQGLEITAGNDAASGDYNEAVTELLDYRASAMPTLKRAIELEPGFCMAHCLRGYMLMMLNSARFHAGAAEELALAGETAADATAREPYRRVVP